MKDKRLIAAYDRLRLDPERARRIYAALERELPPEKEIHVKSKKILHIGLIAAILSVFLVTSAYAATGFVRATGTHDLPLTGHFDSLRQLPKVEKTVGYPVAAPEVLDGGYAFSGMDVTGEAAYGEDNEVLKEWYGVMVQYEKPGAQTLYLNLAPVLDMPVEGERPAATENRTLGGAEVRYSRDHYKLVPPDYEKTEADKAAEAAGHFYLSYGSDAVEEIDYEFASFTLGTVDYVLMDTNGDGPEALFRMAAQVIAAAGGFQNS
ncbi:MAG: hypothetical protein J5927_05640 [Oscillospiraceae bacterium]|nr:hypothetical protein [Oscillospiraceae bacterium]